MKHDRSGLTTGLIPGLAPSRQTVDPEALIKEARARTRRRRRRMALAAALAVVLGGGVFAVVQVTSGPGPARPGGGRPGPARAAAPPRFFVDAPVFAEGPGDLQVRAAGTGRLVTASSGSSSGSGSGDGGKITGLVATGPTAFVVARSGNDCASQLYRIQLGSRGQASQPAALGSPLPGLVSSLAAAEGGRIVGYALSGCGKGAPGYLGVLDTRTGQRRQWTGLATLDGPGAGSLALSGNVSMSADGRLLAFAAAASAQPGGPFTAQQVRVLPTGAAPGPVVSRSRVALQRAGAGSQQAVVLAPAGTAFYLCSQAGSGTRATASIASYSTATGQRQDQVATLATEGVSAQASCGSMSLDSSGRYLLVPTALVPPDTSKLNHELTLTRISLGHGTRSTVRIPLPGGGTMDWPLGMDLAW